MEQSALADKAGVSTETIKRLETDTGAKKAQWSTMDAIKNALENSGVEFLDASKEEGGSGAGVRLAADRDAIIRRKIASEVASLVSTVLEFEVKQGRQANLLEGPSEEVFETIILRLPPLLKIRLKALLD